jgi:PKD repeat protein
VNFTDNSTNTPTNQSWDLDNDGSFDAYGANVSWNFSSSGDHTVCLYASNDAGGDWENKTLTITLTVLRAAFSQTIEGMTVGFLDNSDNALGWFWEFGDGANSTDQNPTHTYFTPNTFTVTLTINNSGVNNSTTNSITVQPIPPGNWHVTIETDENGWLKVLFDFETDANESMVERAAWNFGDGNGSRDMTPAHQYERAGTYLVTLALFDDWGNIGYTTRMVTVGDPEADQTMAYLEWWFEERFIMFMAIVVASIILAGIYVYLADKQWGGANRMFPAIITISGIFCALLLYGG